MCMPKHLDCYCRSHTMSSSQPKREGECRTRLSRPRGVNFVATLHSATVGRQPTPQSGPQQQQQQMARTLYLSVEPCGCGDKLEGGKKLGYVTATLCLHRMRARKKCIHAARRIFPGHRVANFTKGLETYCSRACLLRYAPCRRIAAAAGVNAFRRRKCTAV